MVWCHKKEIIFIHIPKTGGTTVEYYLNCMNYIKGYGIIKNVAFQHFNWDDYNKLLGNVTYKNYFKFTIVRNPIDRCISEFFWTPLNFGYKNGYLFDNFLKEVEDIVKNKRFYDSIYHDHFQSQSYYILNKNNKIMVNKIFRFEIFFKVKNFLKKYTKNQNQIQNKNKNRNKEKLILTKKQKQKIYEIYKENFINFNYYLN
jgi:hypothetical protein